MRKHNNFDFAVVCVAQRMKLKNPERMKYPEWQRWDGMESRRDLGQKSHKGGRKDALWQWLAQGEARATGSGHRDGSVAEAL